MNTPLRAYSYPGLTKSDFLIELGMHAEQDRIVQGKYWHRGKGCAVGCSLHSVSQRLGLKKMDYSKYRLFETYLGIPVVLARLEDQIFEGMAKEDAKKWPLRFAEAVPDGADLINVWNKFAPWMLREIALPAAGKNERARKAIIDVAEGYETNWVTLTPSVARKNAYTADAEAAYAYASADASAYKLTMRQITYLRMANKLVEFISAVPTNTTSGSVP
jgi:hypothetical protein